ncbi:MAG: PKD domain-containing protein [Dehalococcoidia bacterium]
MKKLTLLVVAVAALTVAGIGLTARSASAAPAVSTGGPYAGVAGVGIQFNGSASTGVAPLSFVWNFGDGTTAVGSTPVKAYASRGVFTVTLTVTDGLGFSSQATTTASVTGSAVSAGCVVTVTGAVVCSGVTSTGCVVTAFGAIVCGGGFVHGGCVLTTVGVVCNPFVTNIGHLNPLGNAWPAGVIPPYCAQPVSRTNTLCSRP